MKKITIISFVSLALLGATSTYAANLWYGIGIPVPSTAPPSGTMLISNLAVYNYSGSMSGTPDYTVSSNWSPVTCKTKDDVAKIVGAYKPSDFPLSPPNPITCWQAYSGDNYGFQMWTHAVPYDYVLHSGTWFSSTADNLDLPVDDTGEIIYYRKLPSGSTWTVQQVDCKKGPNFTADWTGVDVQVTQDGSDYYGWVRILPTAVEGTGRCAFQRTGQSTQYHKIDLDRI